MGRFNIKNLIQRVITGIVGFGVLGLAIWLHGYYLKAAVLIVSLIIEYEMIKTVRSTGVQPIAPVLYGFALFMWPVLEVTDLAGVFTLQMICVVLIFVTGIIFERFEFESIFTSIFMLYYPQLFFVFLYLIIDLGKTDLELSRLLVIIAFAASTFTDIAAYFVGNFMGKTPLCPRISPKKTIEGALGGLCGGVGAVLAVALIIDVGRVSIAAYILLAIILSVLAQIGDLAASVVKRRYKVKDFGSILPGHGGFLDRMDSTLFILPVLYIFAKLYFGF